MPINVDDFIDHASPPAPAPSAVDQFIDAVPGPDPDRVLAERQSRTISGTGVHPDPGWQLPEVASQVGASFQKTTAGLVAWGNDLYRGARLQNAVHSPQLMPGGGVSLAEDPQAYLAPPTASQQWAVAANKAADQTIADNPVDTDTGKALVQAGQLLPVMGAAALSGGVGPAAIIFGSHVAGQQVSRAMSYQQPAVDRGEIGQDDALRRAGIEGSGAAIVGTLTGLVPGLGERAQPFVRSLLQSVAAVGSQAAAEDLLAKVHGENVPPADVLTHVLQAAATAGVIHTIFHLFETVAAPEAARQAEAIAGPDVAAIAKKQWDLYQAGTLTREEAVRGQTAEGGGQGLKAADAKKIMALFDSWTREAVGGEQSPRPAPPPASPPEPATPPQSPQPEQLPAPRPPAEPADQSRGLVGAPAGPTATGGFEIGGQIPVNAPQTITHPFTQAQEAPNAGTKPVLFSDAEKEAAAGPAAQPGGSAGLERAGGLPAPAEPGLAPVGPPGGLPAGEQRGPGSLGRSAAPSDESSPAARLPEASPVAGDVAPSPGVQPPVEPRNALERSLDPKELSAVVDAIDNRDAPALQQLLDGRPRARMVFQQRTGIALGSSATKARAALKNWAKDTPPADAGADVQRGDATAPMEVSEADLAKQQGTDSANPHTTGGTIIGQNVPPAPPPARASTGEQAGGGEPEPRGSLLGGVAERVKAISQHISDTAAELSGIAYPRTHRNSPAAGEAMARLASAQTYAREAAPLVAEEVVGTKKDRLGRPAVDSELDKLAGAVLVEDNLRSVGVQAVNRDDMGAAAAVKSIIGGDGSPFRNEGDYQRALRSPEVQGVIARYKKWWVSRGGPEENYRVSQGVAEGEDLPTRGMQTGARVNLKPVTAAGQNAIGVARDARGSASNAMAGQSAFARRAKGTAEGYETRLSKMIENSIDRGQSNADKHRLFDTLRSEGVAVEATGAERPAGKVPVKVWQRGEQKTLYVPPEVAPELRKALDLDAPPPSRIIKGIASLANHTALLSLSEGLTHLANSLGPLYRARGGAYNVAQWFRRGAQLVAKNPQARRQLVELARIGALKPQGETLKGTARFNPLLQGTHQFGKLVEAATRAARLVMSDAYDSAVRAGLTENSEASRRDFVNQLGLYEPKMQHWLLRFARQTALGPFATASTNYAAFGVRGLALSPRLRGASWGATVKMRLGVLGGAAAALGAVALINWIKHKRADGASDIPFGSVRLDDAPDGRHRYFDVASLIGVTRGLRDTGGLAAIEGSRRGDTAGEIADKGARDVANAALQPVAGPVVNAAAVALSGKSIGGFQKAKRAEPGGSQLLENLKAAAKTVNPVIDKLTGGGGSLAGPFGPKTAPRPEESHASQLARKILKDRIGDRPFTDAERAKYDAKISLLEKLRQDHRDGGHEGEDALREKLAAHEVTVAQARTLRAESHKTPLQVRVKDMALMDAMRVWKTAAEQDKDPKQLDELRPVIREKARAAYAAHKVGSKLHDSIIAQIKEGEASPVEEPAQPAAQN